METTKYVPHPCAQPLNLGPLGQMVGWQRPEDDRKRSGLQAHAFCIGACAEQHGCIPSPGISDLVWARWRPEVNLQPYVEIL